VDGSSFSADPQFVVELPDPNGSHYGLNDGYSIPFPTPWIYDPSNPNSQCGTCVSDCGSTNPCTPDQYPAEFEALWESAPDVSTTQYLVYTLQNDPTRTPKLYQVGGKQFFFNGTGTYYYVAPRNDAVDSDAGQDTAVAAAGGSEHPYDGWSGNCVYVLRLGSDGTLQTTGISAPVGQGHDPINWPN
jgi:hypothetical protein